MNASKAKAPFWATHYIVAANGRGDMRPVSEYNGEEGVYFIDGQTRTKREHHLEKLLYKECPEIILKYLDMFPYDANQHTLDAYIARA